MNFDLNATTAFDASIPVGPEAPVPLEEALGFVDRVFGIDTILSDKSLEIVAKYYRQSIPGYAAIYNRWQCMHLALHEPHLDEEGAFFAQAQVVSDLLTSAPGQRVLELGCGLGANTLHLAARHPGTDFIGLDLMAEHVTRARAKASNLPNASFRCASFDALPEDAEGFDVIFAVETLCYARSTDDLALRLARLLRPGGWVVIFDAHRKEGFETFPVALVTAARLYEATTAVTRGFHRDGAWERALTAAGLVAASESITAKTHQGLATLHRRATKVFVDPKWRLMLRTMPRYFARNAVAGLLGYHVCFGDGPEPDPERGVIAYQQIMARKDVY
ncbi:class I SAM-dependent methyltransferase [Pseudotabrizicola alkalilacus]|uniref:Class I SAM-dependent methyltransferase n=1 Tax=Pseudotabrizicola alkalilacus TaxID=2305252 RepID=A0A411Z6W4_9RHOB|nr:class I SAM-dependent methyltransferase [Pseudotabrizicola alkalilacus]RGP38775.1 class I SAM-dependent methyltransferase [Pseudotabrizicola alkalilacus]